MLNKAKGNMYGFVTHTWNPIKGLCPHQCSYCYMKKMYKRYKWNPELRLDEKCFNDDLNKLGFIFVGSSTDMWSEEISIDWIRKVLNHCMSYDNQYLFQSKNPDKFLEYRNYHQLSFPEKIIFATTIETDNQDIINKFAPNAPSIESRVKAMNKLGKAKKMVTLEPLMDFDLEQFVFIIETTIPNQVNLGADSGHNSLPEPSADKIHALITELEKFTKVYQKDNLKRLMEEK